MTKWIEHGKLASAYDKTEIVRNYPPLKKGNDLRTPFEKDRDRIIHCAAFRRLQGKTQVFGMGGSDFFRTRLTHSLEVAQIGKGIVISCGNANTELVEAACLAHDIGHPPFGHTGEDVLKELMCDHGGFEGNAQNLRILTKLELRSAKQGGPGLNITRATIDALLKYKFSYSEIDKNKPLAEWKFYYDDDESLVEWGSLGAPNDDVKSFECQIMNWADDVAYSTHDLEDGLKVGMISESKITERIVNNVKSRIEKQGQTWDNKIWHEIYDKIKNVSTGNATASDEKAKRRDLIASLIHEFIISSKAKKRTSGSYPSRYSFVLATDPKIKLKCNMLKSLVWELIINDEHVATLQRKATMVITKLFQEFTSFDNELTFKMYPSDFRDKLDKAQTDDERFRIACDFISGMTDNYAAKLYSRLTDSDYNSLLDII